MFRFSFYLLANIIAGAATLLICTALVVGCGSSGDSQSSGVLEELESNQDEFVRLPYGSGSPSDPLFPSAGGTTNSDSSGSGNGSPEVPGSGTSSRVISYFLWKPESSQDGNLAVLVNVGNVEIVVNGTESLRNTSIDPSRGTTGRSDKNGCEYGDNVTVEFFDSAGRIVRLKNGDSKVIVKDGCERGEFTL